MLRFGTDGVRGNAETDLTPELIAALGRAIVAVLHPERLLIGRDTRESGLRIQQELAGAGPSVELGVLPTPAIAFTAARLGLPAAVVSASHNPWIDNGVKVIGPDGYKLADDVEAAIEAAIDPGSAGREVARLERTEDAADLYVQHLVSALDAPSLGGLRVVLDCANGAAYEVGPRALRAAGADVTVLHAEPNGRNINEGCGSTHPESLQRAVLEQGAALGLALDGDADRVLAVDQTGALVDGDQIMTMLALDRRVDAVVVTVMTNLGLRHALHDAGIDVIETPVGDRYVVEAMRSGGIAIGGEQSGHIVFSQYATTGDGLLTGLLVAELMHRRRRPLSALAAQMTRYPQALVNVRVGKRVDLGDAPNVWAAVREVERELGDDGRVLVRASGTEPLVRIMVEATSQTVADAAAERLRPVVETDFGT